MPNLFPSCRLKKYMEDLMASGKSMYTIQLSLN